jgi:two-component system response regulator BaeR
MNQRILIVEDQTKLAESISKYLRSHGYDTHILYEGTGVSEYVKENTPDLIILDLMLPGVDGLTVCRDVRGFSTIPIIMVTAKSEEIDKLLGLEMGADDYMSKPFSQRELVARIKAVLRRQEYSVADSRPSSNACSLLLDISNSTASYEGNKIELTAIEFNIMAKLMAMPGRVFNRDNLIDFAYADGRVVNDRTIDSHMMKIRKKLIQIAPDRKFVHSIYSLGYKFEP